MRGCKPFVVVVVTLASVLYLGAWSIGWANPGDLKWKYPSAGGNHNSVVIDGQGNRILVTTDTSTTYRWYVISIDRDSHLNWQRSYDNVYSEAVAIDSKDNAIVVGYENNGSDKDWKIISYSPTGGINWQRSYSGGHGYDYVHAVAIDSKDNVIVEGYENNGSDYDWKIISRSEERRVR